ncbi:putative mitochondrial protein, partial [Mucuna pruriens]
MEPKLACKPDMYGAGIGMDSVENKRNYGARVDMQTRHVRSRSRHGLGRTRKPRRVRSWIEENKFGHARFYRRFMKNFSKIVLPLSKLLQKDMDFKFDQLCVEAFQEVKNRLTSTPIL